MTKPCIFGARDGGSLLLQPLPPNQAAVRVETDVVKRVRTRTGTLTETTYRGIWATCAGCREHCKNQFRAKSA